MELLKLFASLSLETDEYEKGLDSAEKQASSFKDKLGKASQTVQKLGGIFDTVAGAGYNLAKQTANQADTIDKNSQKLGVSAEAYQKWDYVMNLAGTSMDHMGTGLKTLTNKLDDAKNGSSDAQAMFEKLGLSFEDLNTMSREEVFEAAIYGFQGMADSTERAALANDLFGKSGQELTPLFNQTAESTQELMQNLEDMGGVMSDDAVKAGADFNDSLTTLQAAFGGMVNGIAGELLPTFTNLINKITEFVSSGGLQKIVSLFQDMMPVISAVVGAFAGFSILAKIISLVQTVIGVVTALAPAFSALFAVLAANPFMIIVGLIAGVVAILTTLWNTNEGFKNAVINIWNTIKNAISTAINAIGEFFSVTLPAKIETALEWLKKIPEKFVEVGSNLVTGLWNGISSGWDWLVDQVKALAGKLIDGVKGIFGIHSPSRVFAQIGEFCTEGFNEGLEELGDMSGIERQINAGIRGMNLDSVGLSGNFSAGAIGDAGDMNVNVMLTGDAADIFGVVKKQNQRYFKQNGKSAFA